MCTRFSTLASMAVSAAEASARRVRNAAPVVPAQTSPACDRRRRGSRDPFVRGPSSATTLRGCRDSVPLPGDPSRALPSERGLSAARAYLACERNQDACGNRESSMPTRRLQGQILSTCAKTSEIGMPRPTRGDPASAARIMPAPRKLAHFSTGRKSEPESSGRFHRS